MKKPVHNPREVAEIVAIQALSFVASEPERLGLFLAESGIGPESLRAAAADPRFLAGFERVCAGGGVALYRNRDAGSRGIERARSGLADVRSGPETPPGK